MRRLRAVLLAAGAGRRMGAPKALVEDWAERALHALRAADAPISIVIGAEADRVRQQVEACASYEPGRDRLVVAPDWADGMGASLRAGLATVDHDEDALVHLIDLPDVGPEVVRRVCAAAAGPETLARAAYAGGRLGHPVLLGSAHVSTVGAWAVGDQGARRYLSGHEVVAVGCADLAEGRDRDTPEDLRR